VTGVLVFIGWIGSKLATAIAGFVRKIFPPRVEPPKVEPPKTEPPKTEPPKPVIPRTLAELRAALNERAGRAFEQQQQLLTDQRFKQMTDGLKNADGTFNVDKANQFFEKKLLPEDQFKAKVEEQAKTFGERSQKAAEKIKNICDETDGTNRPDATVGDGTTEAALSQEASTGKPVGGRGHAIKARDAIRDLRRNINEIETNRRFVQDETIRAEGEAAVARANQRIAKMEPALNEWNNRVANHPDAWNADGTSKTTPNFPKDPGPMKP
jgi:hypothetical protein